MGLDMYMFRQKKIKFPLVFNNIQELKEFGYGFKYEFRKEIMYWRKCFPIHNFINDMLGEVKNCEDYILSKENIIELLNFCKEYKKKENEIEYIENWEYDIEQLQKIIDEIDFDKYDIVYHAWW